MHTYREPVNIGAVIVGVLAHSWHIWGTHGHVCPHQHTVFFSKCVCVCMCVCVFISRNWAFPLFFSLLSTSLPLSELISMLRVCVFHLGLPLEIFACLCCSARRSPNSGGLIQAHGRPLKGPLVLSGQAPFRE